MEPEEVIENTVSPSTFGQGLGEASIEQSIKPEGTSPSEDSAANDPSQAEAADGSADENAIRTDLLEISDGIISLTSEIAKTLSETSKEQYRPLIEDQIGTVIQQVEILRGVVQDLAILEEELKRKINCAPEKETITPAVSLPLDIAIEKIGIQAPNLAKENPRNCSIALDVYDAPFPASTLSVWIPKVGDKLELTEVQYKVPPAPPEGGPSWHVVSITTEQLKNDGKLLSDFETVQVVGYVFGEVEKPNASERHLVIPTELHNVRVDHRALLSPQAERSVDIWPIATLAMTFVVIILVVQARFRTS